MNTIEGNLLAPKGRFALVASRFNDLVVQNLVAGAIDGLTRHGVAPADIDVVRVPGAFELPLAAQKLAAGKKYAAVLCLGAVIRGDTDHYDHVAGSATSGILQAGLTTGVPVIFGLLTCENLEQALNRAGGKGGNKGFDAALTALEMVDLLGKIG